MLQQSCLHALRVLLMSCTPPDMDVPLLQNVPEGALDQKQEPRIRIRTANLMLVRRSHGHSQTLCEAFIMDGVSAALWIDAQAGSLPSYALHTTCVWSAGGSNAKY